MPPAFCASAMIWRVMVVLPLDSGPKISMTRPRGTPPTPSAASNEIDPVEMTEIGTTASLVPSFMMEPFPNCFSICEMAVSTARFLSVFSSAMSAAPSRLAGCYGYRKGFEFYYLHDEIHRRTALAKAVKRGFVDGVVYTQFKAKK